MQNMQITAWGDSITYGVGDEYALGWVGRLRKVFYQDGHKVYNRGVCGNTSEDILERFDIVRRSTEPSVILLAVGINDSKFPNGGNEQKVPVLTFQENIRHLISKAKQTESRVLLVGLTAVSEDDVESSSIFTNESIQQYDSYLREVAEETDSEFIDIREVLDPNVDLVDGLHPKAAGYEKMFRKILPVVENK